MSAGHPIPVFFRNDDVGTDPGPGVSPALAAVTDVFLEEEVPISHGVVPARVDGETVRWLAAAKDARPDLVGIDQHGYAHERVLRGEFGGGRAFAQQRADIAAGKERMERHFGAAFSRVFTVPWSQYDAGTKRACDELGYGVFSADCHPNPRAVVRLAEAVLRAAGASAVGGRRVSYHHRGYQQRGLRIREISVSVDLVDDEYAGRLATPEAALARFERHRTLLPSVGFMLHHRLWDSDEKLASLRRLLRLLKRDPGVRFRLLEAVA